MPYLLALSSAFVYGAADFIGGLTARRADTFSVVIVSQFAGLILLGVSVPFTDVVAVTRADLLWGALAGVCGSTGVALLYRGLAISTMSVVAPTTAVCAVIVPVVVEVARGERLGAWTVAGIVLALVGIVLVAQEKWGSRPHFSPGLGLAFLAGIAIGGFYLSLAQASGDAGLWPLLGARSASVVLFVALALATKRTVTMARPAVGMAVACGALDMLANAFYLIATWSGSLSVIVTLSSLYPASTVLLARLFLRERLALLQAIGVVCALVAVLLIVGGT